MKVKCDKQDTVDWSFKALQRLNSVCPVVTFPKAPKTIVILNGEIVYEEVNRVGVSRLEVAEMAAGEPETRRRYYTSSKGK